MYQNQFELKPEFDLRTSTISGSGIMNTLILRMIELLHARQQLDLGKNQVEVTDYIFNLRHPELKKVYRPHMKRQVIDKRYSEEWNNIFLNIVGTVYFSLPRPPAKPNSGRMPPPAAKKKDGTWEALKWLLNHMGRPREL